MRLLKNIENRFGVANGTLFLTACTLIIKAVGFAYKIPLYNAIGTNGAGLYQTVFALFSLLVAITATGVPSSMTKIIAKNTVLGMLLFGVGDYIWANVSQALDNENQFDYYY